MRCPLTANRSISATTEPIVATISLYACEERERPARQPRRTQGAHVARSSSLRLGDIPGMAVAVAALGHEHVELGLVLGLAQALEELPELALLLF